MNRLLCRIYGQACCVLCGCLGLHEPTCSTVVLPEQNVLLQGSPAWCVYMSTDVVAMCQQLMDCATAGGLVCWVWKIFTLELTCSGYVHVFVLLLQGSLGVCCTWCTRHACASTLHISICV